MYDAPVSDTHRQTQYETRYDAPPPDTSVKVAHLVFALLFLGAAGIWALVETDVITAERLTVLAPALLIAAGVIGLAASLASSRNRRRLHAGPTDGPPSDPGFDSGSGAGSRASLHDDADRGDIDRDDTEPTRELR